MRCRDVMVTAVVSCRVSEPASHCARLMRDRHVGFLPVLDGDGHLAGVVTDRDLVVRLLAEGGPADSPASELMTGNPLVVCGPDEDVRKVEDRMIAAHTSRLVVVDGQGCPVGVVSLTDVAAAESRSRASRVLRQVRRRLPAPLSLP